MPDNTIYIGRPSKWGNPFPVSENNTLEVSLEAYKGLLEMVLKNNPTFLDPLKGKNLACWCPLDKPCHGDIILKKLEEMK